MDMTSTFTEKSSGHRWTPAYLVEKHGHLLSEYEANEVLAYESVFYFAPFVRESKPKTANTISKPTYHDEKGRYICYPHDHIAYRYEILGALGRGTFGDVVRAMDHKTKKHVAIKIVRSDKNDKYANLARFEAETLTFLNRHDPMDEFNIIRMLEHFEFRGHLCLVFELMEGGNLYSVMKDRAFQGLDASVVRDLMQDVLLSLCRLHSRGIMHCDLKPENIMLRDKQSYRAKVIDFGYACLVDEIVFEKVQTCFYRAPEVTLQCGYGPEIDMWSVGCIAAELFTGKPLFPAHDDADELGHQVRILGAPPRRVIEHGKRFSMFFDSNGTPLSSMQGANMKKQEKPASNLTETTGIAGVLGEGVDRELIDFIEGCLQWNPKHRMTAEEALYHPFITGDAYADDEHDDSNSLDFDSVLTPSSALARHSSGSLQSACAVSPALISACLTPSGHTFEDDIQVTGGRRETLV